MNIQEITLIGGRDNNGELETIREVNFRMGNIVSIVGPTGCGKTTLINDIELYADGNTPSGRVVKIDGRIRSQDADGDPSHNPISLISQHTNFLSDLPVQEFIEIHASIRKLADGTTAVRETFDFANQLTGEPLLPSAPMTELSGGQTRALLIADAVVIGNAPIILLDEIENAGIHRTKALELLRRYEKIFIFVTHDPRIALLSDFRIVMRNGAMIRTIERDDDEQIVAAEIRKLDDLLLHFRGQIRAGQRLTSQELTERLRALGYIS